MKPDWPPRACRDREQRKKCYEAPCKGGIYVLCIAIFNSYFIYDNVVIIVYSQNALPTRVSAHSLGSEAK